MRITKATPDDLDALVAFRDEAARWLASKGIDQWQEPWPTEDLMVEGMLRSIEAGETFIVWDDDKPAATITINRFAKPELWTPEEAAEPALYAHKVTVDRAYGGQGLGAELLDWAGTKAADEGADWLRVDVFGRPMSTSSTTTCAKASPTSALSSCPTILQGRCFSGQHSASPRRICKRSRA